MIKITNNNKDITDKINNQLKKAGYNIDSLPKIIKSINNLKNENEEMKNELDMQYKISSTIVHDLRSPLSAIKMSNETMMNSIEDMDFDTRLLFMSTIDNETDRMLSLVNNLLDLFKLKSGKFEIDFEKIDLSDVIVKCYSVLNNLAADKNITVELKIANKIPVSGEFEKLQQIIFNVLSNSIKFTPENGRITITSKIDSENVIISITDTGVGIHEKELPFIFQEFKQLSSKSTKKEKGTGLGLAITKKIVEAHNGKIWIESLIGKGTTVHITFPLRN